MDVGSLSKISHSAVASPQMNIETPGKSTRKSRKQGDAACGISARQKI